MPYQFWPLMELKTTGQGHRQYIPSSANKNSGHQKCGWASLVWQFSASYHTLMYREGNTSTKMTEMWPLGPFWPMCLPSVGSDLYPFVITNLYYMQFPEFSKFQQIIQSEVIVGKPKCEASYPKGTVAWRLLNLWLRWEVRAVLVFS